MKKIRDYNIPEHYIEIIENFYNYLKQSYNDRIMLFTLSGSTVFENIIENVSDIDYILILDKCYPDEYKEIYQYRNQFDLRVGGSIFTSDELKYKQIDYLAMYYLYLIREGYIEPICMSDNFVNNITKNDMLNSIRNVVILNLRTLKKMVYSRNIKDSRVLIKNLLFLEKDFLILNGFYCKSKDEIVYKFNQLFNLNFNLSIISCLHNNLSDQELSVLLNYIDEVIILLTYFNFNDDVKLLKK